MLEQDEKIQAFAVWEEQHLLQLLDFLENAEKKMGEIPLENPVDAALVLETFRKGFHDWAQEVREERRELHPVL